METIVTLATIPAILALVNLAKNLGLSGKWSALLAVVLGIIFSTTDYAFTAATQTSSGMYLAIMAGAVLGLSASGLYDIAGKFDPNDPVEIAVVETVPEPEDKVEDIQAILE